MLSPEYLNSIEFNDVVQLYNELNIDITADIIDRVSKMQDITITTRNQLKVLLQTNGNEVFDEALEKTSMLTAETKKRLKKIFTDVAKEDIQGYKELFEYKNKVFKLSEEQYKILNQGLKETNNTLKNFTNTIAFQSQQMYVEAVDKAYFKVMSGAFDYNAAINAAVQELADKGITLKDRAGRNVQLEVAVRRNVLSGIQKTANEINRDIEKDLGCDGYEVTAHIGARPSHAEAQGKQYAINHDTKISKKYPLWQDVKDLWEDYNCRHSYFGIILGISEPQYSDSELKEFKDAKVTLNDEEIPFYEATQKQRAIENAIRKQKRAVRTLEKANINFSTAKSKLARLQKQYKDFCKETRLEKDYARTKIAASKKTIKDTKYEDVTNNYTKTQKYEIKEQQYFKDSKGTTYKVDGKHVVMEATNKEKEVASLLGRIIGGQVNIIPRVNEPAAVKTPDYIVNNESYDLKQITGGGKWTIEGNLKGKKEQSNNFIIDITNAKLSIEEAQRQIQVIYNSKHYSWVDKILLIKNNEIIKVYKRR